MPRNLILIAITQVVHQNMRLQNVMPSERNQGKKGSDIIKKKKLLPGLLLRLEKNNDACMEFYRCSFQVTYKPKFARSFVFNEFRTARKSFSLSNADLGCAVKTENCGGSRADTFPFSYISSFSLRE